MIYSDLRGRTQHKTSLSPLLYVEPEKNHYLCVNVTLFAFHSTCFPSFFMLFPLLFLSSCHTTSALGEGTSKIKG